jgi:hypothetical protein
MCSSSHEIHCLEVKGSEYSVCFPQPIVSPYPEPDESSPLPQTLLPKDPF